MGVVLRLLGTFTATTVIHEIDDGEVGRHREENPISNELVFCSLVASEITHHSSAPKTVVA